MGPATGVITAQENAEFIEAKHATPLIKYGKHDLGAVNSPSTRYGPLIAEGGIEELPLSQMQAFGWHHIPAVVAKVPALADTIEFYCENGCPKDGKKGRWFLSEDVLRKHTEALHRDAAAPAAVGRSIANALAEVSSFQQMDQSGLVSAVVVAIKAYEDSKDAPDEEETEEPVSDEGENVEDETSTEAESDAEASPGNKLIEAMNKNSEDS